MIAELGMYPFASVRWAWDELWAAVHRRAPWTPPELAHTGDVHACWADPGCVVNHVCGWPLARWHSAAHRVVGTFALTIPEADGHRYRSVIVATRPAALEELVRPGTRAVANSADSLSGWVSFLAATVGPAGNWPGEVEFTGAHHESLRRLASGAADVACVDSWTLALIAREEPDLTDGLHHIALGPLVPSPAITIRRSIPTSHAETLATALEAATSDPGLAPAIEALHVSGFVRTTIDDYLPTLDLAAT